MDCVGSQMVIVGVPPNNGQLSNVVEPENADGIEDVAIVQDDVPDDDLDEVQQKMESEVVLEDQVDKNGGLVPAPLAASANPEIFNNYRLQKEWDTEELIVNMRAVGRILKFSKNVIDLAMDVLRENVMDGASMSYQTENLTEFFELCPVVVGVRTAITKILQAMGQKELDG